MVMPCGMWGSVFAMFYISLVGQTVLLGESGESG
jgi:hypothetical protein